MIINEGVLQEYDYNNETEECSWKIEHKKSDENLKKYNHCVVYEDNHNWGGL